MAVTKQIGGTNDVDNVDITQGGDALERLPVDS